MVHTGEEAPLDPELARFLEQMGGSYEFYLPDEKISSIWQETEIISTVYPDFEAIYFERELEGGWLYISNELEFFPIYMLYQMQKMGKPTIMQQGHFVENEMINLEDGEEIWIVGFADPDSQDKLKSAVPPVEDQEELSFDLLKAIAMLYLDEII